MSSSWKENLKSQLNKKETTSESSESFIKTKSKKSRISTEKLQQELNKLKKEVRLLKQEGIQENFIPTIHELNICYQGLCRVIRQLSGNRSTDFRNQAILVKEKVETYLIQKGIIKGSE